VREARPRARRTRPSLQCGSVKAVRQQSEYGGVRKQRREGHAPTWNGMYARLSSAKRPPACSICARVSGSQRAGHQRAGSGAK
jgi:hypothetical protein